MSILAHVEAHARVLDVAVSPDGRKLATSGADGTVKLWDAGTLPLERVLPCHTAATWSVAISPADRQLGTASSDGTPRVWDVASGAESRKLMGVSRGIATVALAARRRRSRHHGLGPHAGTGGLGCREGLVGRRHARPLARARREAHRDVRLVGRRTALLRRHVR